jgi:phage-related minor tail protein
MLQRFKGAGVYNKESGELINLGKPDFIDRGEVYEGTREDYNQTFGIEDEVILTKDELINLIDQSDCKAEGVLSNYQHKNRETISDWIDDRWDSVGGEAY